jgi:glucokinase
MDFAPCNNLEIELFIYLKNKFGHVSYERVLSGPGLVNIYNFLKDGKYADEPAELTERFKNQDPAVIISKAGQAAEFEICVKALDIFASILGAQAGNLVLTLLTTSGVYLGGGIPPKIYKKLMEGITVASYLNKGRLSYLVEKTPLYIVRDDYAALLGAASIAEKMS